MLLEIPSKLETTRLILRQYQNGDGSALFTLLERGSNREYLKPHVDEATTIRTLESAEIRVREFNAYWVAREKFILGIWLKSSNLYIGQLWIEPKRWEVPLFELGWFLDQSQQHQGYATEAAQTGIDFLFNNLKAHKIAVLTRDDNIKSYKLAERCGFVREGHLRDHAIIEGKRFGLFCYALLKHEYNPEINRKDD